MLLLVVVRRHHQQIHAARHRPAQLRPEELRRLRQRRGRRALRRGDQRVKYGVRVREQLRPRALPRLRHTRGVERVDRRVTRGADRVPRQRHDRRLCHAVRDLIDRRRHPPLPAEDVPQNLLQRAPVRRPRRRCLLAAERLHLAHHREAARPQDLDESLLLLLAIQLQRDPQLVLERQRRRVRLATLYRRAGIDDERRRHRAHLDGRTVILQLARVAVAVRPVRCRRFERLAGARLTRLPAVHDDALRQDPVADIVERRHDARLARRLRVEHPPEHARDRTLLAPVAPERHVAQPVQRLQRMAIAHRERRQPRLPHQLDDPRAFVDAHVPARMRAVVLRQPPEDLL